MGRQPPAEGFLIVGSLVAGTFFALMTGIGLWILRQSALGQLTLSHAEAIVGLVVLGTLGLVLSGLNYASRKPIVEFEQREQARAARLEAGTITVSHDITECKHVEEALRACEAILEAVPDANILVNRQGAIVKVNSQAEKMFGYSRGELVGMSLEQLMPERFRTVHVAHRDRYHAAPYTRPIGIGLDLFALRKDGSEVPVEISLSPMDTPDGLIIIASIRDITERKRALGEIIQRTAELQKSQELNRLKDHFLSSLSHEMKTPLSLICGYAELLEEKYPHEVALDGLMDGIRRLNEHISSMLDHSALVSGSLPLYKTEVNLAELIPIVHAAVEEDLRFKNLHFITEVDPETPPIQADPRRISQMIRELISNAIKFTPEGGTLGILCCPGHDMIRIEVWDTGAGIPKPDQSRIWEAFTQLDVGDALRKGGLGLGLTIVKGLAELHGGYVELESELGKGSHFRVYLPIDDASNVPGHAER